MDELELLKKNWKKQEEALPKLSYKDIYQMMLKKSSSIVKWIFVISILEFILWASLDIVYRTSSLYSEMDEGFMATFSVISSIVSYTVLIYFMFRFYLNYRKIQSTDSTKKLMHTIIRTRKTVKQYIWINLILLATLMISSTVYLVFLTDEFQKSTNEQTAPAWLFIVVMIVVIAIFIGLVALFYRLIYGILTRRLQDNYDELEKLEL